MFMLRIINHHGTPVKINSMGEKLFNKKKPSSLFFVQNLINQAFEVKSSKLKKNLLFTHLPQPDNESDPHIPQVSEILKERKINPMDLVSRNETVSVRIW